MLGQAGAWQPAIRRDECGHLIWDTPWARSSSGSWVFFLSISCEEPGEASAAGSSKVSPMNV